MAQAQAGGISCKDKHWKPCQATKNMACKDEIDNNFLTLTGNSIFFFLILLFNKVISNLWTKNSSLQTGNNGKAKNKKKRVTVKRRYDLG